MLFSLFLSSWGKTGAAARSPDTAVTEDGDGEEDVRTKPERDKPREPSPLRTKDRLMGSADRVTGLEDFSSELWRKRKWLPFGWLSSSEIYQAVAAVSSRLAIRLLGIFPIGRPDYERGMRVHCICSRQSITVISNASPERNNQNEPCTHKRQHSPYSNYLPQPREATSVDCRKCLMAADIK